MTATYRTRITAAYQLAASEFAALKAAAGDAWEPDPDELRSIVARLGAACAAAGKAASRDWIIEQLKTSSEDITPAVAINVSRSLQGRGISNRAALAAFAVPGRTAANKSKADPEAIAIELQAKFSDYLVELQAIRHEVQLEHWSSVRRELDVAVMSAEEIWRFKRSNQAADLAAVTSGRLKGDEMNWFKGGLAKRSKVIDSPF